MLEVALLAILACTLFAMVAAGLFLVKVLLWIVLLPFRLLLGLLLLPLLAIKAIVSVIGLILVGPFILAALLIGGLFAALALLAPLVPLALLALLVWIVVRATQPAPVGAGFPQ